jgi:hypothetical protein
MKSGTRLLGEENVDIFAIQLVVIEATGKKTVLQDILSGNGRLAAGKKAMN